MSRITIQVLEGVERGRSFEELLTPVTIGREEENVIRLNDERVSRFHAKLQEDAGRVILTDLGSTNGTRVNGRSVEVRIMRLGDQIAIGRCLLLYGSQEQIIAWAEQQHPPRSAPRQTPLAHEGEDEDDDTDGPVSALNVGSENRSQLSANRNLLAPPLGLSLSQRAEMADLLDHVHNEIRCVLTSAEEVSPDRHKLPDMKVCGTGWQRLLRLEMGLAVALRNVAEPDDDTH